MLPPVSNNYLRDMSRYRGSMEIVLIIYRTKNYKLKGRTHIISVTDMQISTVIRAMKYLEKCNLITIENQRGSNMKIQTLTLRGIELGKILHGMDKMSPVKIEEVWKTTKINTLFCKNPQVSR